MLRRRLDDFYIVSKIASGGMSVVYLGVSSRTDEKRAVKILSKGASTSRKADARFLREIEILRNLKHPSIITILSSGVLDDAYYYMMPYFVRGSLAHIPRKDLSQKDILVLFQTVCKAIDYAHRMGVIHRDLKPSNILVSEQGSPVVSDFGIAMRASANEARLTRSTEVMGTLAYLAPEQRVSSKRVDERADIFSLGAILYELIMGFPPLGSFPRPKELKPDWPPLVTEVLDRCLRPDPGQRFSQANEVAEQIDSIVSSLSSPLTAPTKEELSRTPRSTYPVLRVQPWLQELADGTIRQRLETVAEIVRTADDAEIAEMLCRFQQESDRVRWGLIRVLGERRVKEATSVILPELEFANHRECAMEALGRIGSDSAFEALLDYLSPESPASSMVLLPLAQTGKDRAVVHLVPFLSHPMVILRQAAVRALETIKATETLDLLRQFERSEPDDRLRQSTRSSIVALQRELSAAGLQDETVTLHSSPPIKK